MNKRTASVVLSALLLVASQALAQVDPRARALIEDLYSHAEFDEVFTLDQTMTMTIYQDGEEIVTTTRMVVDYANERAAYVTEVMGMAVTMVFQDGTATMNMMGMRMPVPGGADAVFDDAFDQPGVASILDDPDAVITYDGYVDYAGVLHGQQVTYTGDFGMPGLEVDATTVSFVFDDDGFLLGQMVPTDAMDMLFVFLGDPHGEGTMFYDGDIYEYDFASDSATLFASVRYDYIVINGPVDESLFE